MPKLTATALWNLLKFLGLFSDDLAQRGVRSGAHLPAEFLLQLWKMFRAVVGGGEGDSFS